MAQAVPATDIYARIGDVAAGGQVAVGHHIVQIGDVKGGIVYVQKEDPRPPRPRPHPVSLRPRAFPGLLDRATETSESIRALESSESVECTGESGAGKTSFLRHLAHRPQLAGFSAGVIYSQVNRQSNADLLKSLFDAFYEYDSPIKPTDTEIRHYLQNFKALILLDDVDSTAGQIQELMNVAPNCTFITATSQRSLFGEAREVALKGLPTADAIALFERELGRALSAEERNAAEHICELVGCNPQRILRAANQARDEKRSLVDIIPPDPSVPLDQVLAAAEIEARSEDEKKVLSALAVFYGAPVAAQHVGAVAEVSGIERILDDFERRGLVDSHDKQYTLSTDLKNALPGNLTSLRMRALSHFDDWAGKQRGNPEAIANSAQPILLILKWGASARFWPEVTSLGHATEEALTLSGKWDMWGASLESILESARAEGNRAEQAWALHQLGTRALCLGATEEARSSLTTALAMRESLNDERGAAATRHNLNILLGPAPPAESDEPAREPGPGGISPLIKFGLPSLAAAGLLAVLLFGPWFRDGNDGSIGMVDTLPPPPPTAPAAIPAAPPALPQVLSFSASPPAIVTGESSQLCFQLQGASTVAIDGGIPGLQAGAGRQCVSVAPATTTTYRLTASNSDGQTSTSETTVTVSKPAPKITGFSAEPKSLTDQGIVRLCYNALNSAGLEIDHGVGAVTPPNEGCVNTTVNETTTFTLTATGTGGRVVTREATVNVAHPDIGLEFTAEPPTVTRSNAALLCYRASRASSLSIDHDVGQVQMPTPGQRACIAVRPTETTTYTLSAIGSFNRTASLQRTVSVNAPPMKHVQIGDFHASKPRVRAGEPVQLCYQIVDAERASIEPIRRPVPTTSSCIDDSPRRTTRYVLRAAGEDNKPESLSVNVEVVRQPPVVIPTGILEFSPDMQTINVRDSAKICYRTLGVTAAEISPDVGSVPPSIFGDKKCVKVSPRQATEYTLTATGPEGTQTRKVKVKVLFPVE